MKRKITKASIEELRKEMPVLNEEEERCIIGGGNLYILDGNGRVLYQGTNPYSEKTAVAFGSIDSGNVFYTSGNILLTTTDSECMLSGSGVSKDMFEFFAQNTSVEWALYEDSKTGYCFLTTSHENRSVNVYNYPGYDSFYHNHEINHLPGDADLDFSAGNYYDYYYIYHEPSDSYIGF